MLLELSQVEVAYRQSLICQGVSLAVDRNEVVCLLGRNGVGKTTLMRSLMGILPNRAGKILFEGQDVTHLPSHERARRGMAYVPQDPAVFATSIAENIRYGSPEASDDDVRRAARTALASPFIDSLPLAYETPLGERGVTLSGGQRQRIAIARAVLRNAPILLLDEATSALDAESENLVQTALNRVMQERTTLVIAHRLATVLSADRILVLDKGKIVEEGTHHSLIERGGVYARLAELQFSREAGAA